MKYSEIVGPKFYGIKLKEQDQYLVDVHFTAQAHHFWRMLENRENEIVHKFHLLRHRAHLRAMMIIIYVKGDFTVARDQSHRDLDMREGWNPDKVVLPDPGMNDRMHPNPFHKAGEDHPSDYYLSVSDEEHARRKFFSIVNSTGKWSKGKRYAV